MRSSSSFLKYSVLKQIDDALYNQRILYDSALSLQHNVSTVFLVRLRHTIDKLAPGRKVGLGSLLLQERAPCRFQRLENPRIAVADEKTANNWL